MNTKERFLKDFGKKLAAARHKRGLTQEELADVIDVHRTYIGFVEQGKRNPTIANVRKMAKALKVDLSDLFRGL